MTQWLYHVTSKENYESIKEEGMNTDQNLGGLFFGDDDKVLEWYGPDIKEPVVLKVNMLDLLDACGQIIKPKRGIHMFDIIGIPLGEDWGNSYDCVISPEKIKLAVDVKEARKRLERR
jgi:hypothetical protein